MTISSPRRIGVALLAALAISGSFLGGEAFGAQTHISAALEALTTARTELTASKPDKGGHRDKALDLVNQAIEQVHEGIAYARSH